MTGLFLWEDVPQKLLPWLAAAEEGWLPDGVVSRGEYYVSTVVESGNYELHYRSDGRYVYVAMKAKTRGWVGVGIEAGPGQGMGDASMAYGYVKDGRATLIDSVGTGPHSHAPDVEMGGSDDIIQYGGREEDGITVIEFMRPVDTGDPLDIPYTAGKLGVIWAYGPDDDVGMHVERGRVEVDFR
jgi:hypothetical protein